jgi:hypothetical protein
MTKSRDRKGDGQRSGPVGLHSLPTDSDELRTAESVSQQEIDDAIERARRALEELERAPRQTVCIDSTLRFG